MKLQLKRSNVIESGAAKEPTASQLEYGELAINYNTNDPAIFLKDSNNNVIRISGVGNIADDGQVELPASTTPPLNPLPGNLWYNSEDGRLYIYYKDIDTEQWVDASPDSWDPSSYPDVTDDDAQAGTLDDRYLMLNSANDPVTGGLNITGGNVGIGTTNPIRALEVQTGTGIGGFKQSSSSLATTLELLRNGAGTVANNAIEVSHSDGIGAAINYGGGAYFKANVGIGTDAPDYKLEVTDTTNEAITAKFATGADNNFELVTANGSATNSSGQEVSRFGINYRGQGWNSYLQFNRGTGATSGSIAIVTSQSEAMRINSSGNVGIGTIFPSDKLQIVAGSYANNQAGGIKFSLGDSTTDRIVYRTGIKTNAGGSSRYFVESPTNTSGGSAETFCITSDGKVGIGTSEPSSLLHLRGTTNAGGILIEDSSGASGSPAIEIIGKRSDANSSPAFSGKLCLAGNRLDGAVSTGKIIGTVMFGGNHTDGSTSNILYAASIGGVAEGTFSNSSTMPTGLAFYTGPTGRTPDVANVKVGTERMRIDSNGNVGIAVNSPVKKLDVFGTVGVKHGSYLTQFVTSATFIDNDKLKLNGAAYGGILLGANGPSSQYYSKLFFAGNRADSANMPLGGIDGFYVDELTTGSTSVSDATGARISFRNAVNNTNQTRITFSTRNSQNNLSERLTIEPDGRLQITTTSPGLSFGGVADSNTLDDYEEGLWTPTVTGGTTAGNYTGGFTGNYTKIGNMVYLRGQLLNLSTVSAGSGNLVIGNLPFTSLNHYTAGSVYLNFFALEANSAGMALRLDANQNRLFIVKNIPSATSSLVKVGDIVSANADVVFQISYLTS